MYEGQATLGAILARRAAERPDHAVVCFESETVTYGELDERSSRVANSLLGLGLAKGDKAAILLENCPAFLDAWFGMAKAGIVEVPVNTAQRGDLLAYVLDHAECKALVVDERLLPNVAAVAGRLPGLGHVFVRGEPVGAGRLDARPFEELLAGSPEPPGVEVEPADTSVILFTSGTTGPSKGAVLSYNANFHLGRSVIEAMRYREDDVLFTAFPLFHVNAKYTSVLVAMLLDRGRLVMHPRFSASRFWDICREHEVTAFNFMGALLAMLMKQPERPGDRDHSVRCAYGAPAPATIFAEFERRFGVRLVEVYGSTECGAVLANDLGAPLPGSCGRQQPFLHFAVEIHGEDDERCPPGVPGEICIRPLLPDIMFSHYYRQEEATLHAFRNLWFHSGDRGVTDEDGSFTFLDRMKDAIRRRGENISSWEVEKVLDTHPAVRESAVVGVPSELTEEEVLAVVVVKEGHTLTPGELLDFCQERLAHFAVPRYVRFVEELPKTPSQRIEKYKLREEGLTADAWDRESVGYVVRR